VDIGKGIAHGGYVGARRGGVNLRHMRDGARQAGTAPLGQTSLAARIPLTRQ
jgi:hypothetical protein